MRCSHKQAKVNIKEVVINDISITSEFILSNGAPYTVLSGVDWCLYYVGDAVEFYGITYRIAGRYIESETRKRIHIVYAITN